MQILQIMPADGWYAAFNDIAAAEQYYQPLVCWALVAEEGAQFVTGMVAVETKIVACADDTNFSHYVNQDTFTDMIDQDGE